MLLRRASHQPAGEVIGCQWLSASAIVDRQIAMPPQVAFLRVLEGHRVGPFPEDSLDKALGLAVGAWRVRPRSVSHVAPRPGDSA